MKRCSMECLFFFCDYPEKKSAVSDTAYSTLLFKLVPRPGVEPGRVAPLVFETSARFRHLGSKSGCKDTKIFLIHKTFYKKTVKYLVFSIMFCNFTPRNKKNYKSNI